MNDLQFDWEAVLDKPILGVVGCGERRMNGDSLRWDALAFLLDDSAVLLTVNLDTDEIIVANGPMPEGDDWVAVPAFQNAVGKSLGWCWIGNNYLGYRDSFTLALRDVVPGLALQPRLTFIGEGSSLSCFDLTPLKAAGPMRAETGETEAGPIEIVVTARRLDKA